MKGNEMDKLTAEQALSIMEQSLVSRQGLTLREMSALMVAWNMMVELVQRQNQKPSADEKKPVPSQEELDSARKEGRKIAEACK
jgi:hypothetical protein